jgi:hypothetical protein
MTPTVRPGPTILASPQVGSVGTILTRLAVFGSQSHLERVSVTASFLET